MKLTTLRPLRYSHTWVVTCALLLTTGCLGNLAFNSSNGSGSTGGDTGNSTGGTSTGGGSNITNAPFDASPPNVYVTKVKSILANAAPTDAELTAITNDPCSLRTYIQTWMQTPQFMANQRRFFEQAFQQNPAISYSEDYIGVGPDANTLKNLHESFARTVEANIAAGQPFNYSINTNQFMMTTAMMIWYGVADSISIYNLNGYNSIENANVTYTFTPSGPVALSDTLNPQSANYMKWYDPSVATAKQKPECYAANGDLVVSINNAPAGGRGQNLSDTLYYFLTQHGYQTWLQYGPQTRCFWPGKHPAVLSPSDYSDWRMVTIRQPNPGETADNFWEIIKFRSASELVLHIPRVGFFTTPSFLAQYSSNQSNQARVTTNQSMIVGLNHAFDGSTLATPGMNMAALDSSHAAPSTPCYSCHQTLDPMRQFFLKQYNFYFTLQTESQYEKISGWFDYGGVSQPGNTINDFATIIATHPSFALAWTEKLCNFVNSTPCNPADPELLSVAAKFQASNLNWPTLVVDLLSSPLVTYASPTVTAVQAGQSLTIARQQQLCNNLSARLNITDICGLAPGTVVPTELAPMQAVAAALPTDQYSRGATVLPLVTTPGLIYRSSLENFCAALATYVVSGSKALYTTSNTAQSFNAMGVDIMGLTPDTEAPAVALLQAHYNNAIAAHATPTVALESTAMLACLSPLSIGVGLGL